VTFSFPLVKAIIKRFRRALENVVEARLSFESLTDAAPPEAVDIWEATIQDAESKRSENIKAMDVMHSKIKTAQSLKAIKAAVMDEEKAERHVGTDGSSTTDWLLEGFNIEDEQWVTGIYSGRVIQLITFNRVRIRQLVRKAGLHPTPDDVRNIALKRQRISTKINDFHMTANRNFGANVVATLLGTHDTLNDDGYVSDDTREPLERGMAAVMSEVENTILAFPSAIPGELNSLILELRERECRLRRGKANDTLGHVRETLSGLSYQYINKVRQAKTNKDHLRAYSGIKLLSKEVSFYQQVYNRNSRALGLLDPSLRLRYPLLRRSDCTINTAIADVNARGQSQARLPWLWAAQDGWEGEEEAAQNSLLDNDRLLECEFMWLIYYYYCFLINCPV
jgi:hypothetical protein